MPPFRTLAASPWPYAAWLLLSAIGLVVADRMHPYALVAAVYVAVPVSCVLLVVALAGGWRAILPAVLACVPTLLAFRRLSTIHWA